MDKTIAAKTKKPNMLAPVIAPEWLDVQWLAVQSRSFQAFKNAEGNESVMITHIANSVTYRMWMSIIKAPDRVNKYWRDHSGNEPTPADVMEFLARAGELRDTAQIQVRPKGRYFEIIGIKAARRRPVPIAGRVSNAELQAAIDATLDIRILGDTKLRDVPRPGRAIKMKR